MNLRRLAAGKPCQVRIPMVCNGNPETTVLAHVRMSGISGMGLKASDLFGAWCCSACHDEIDRRTRRLGHDEAKLAHLEGVIRTQDAIAREGFIRW